MKNKVGVMGSAEEPSTAPCKKAMALGKVIAGRELILLTGATTGLVYEVGNAAREAGAFHIGNSPASYERAHVERYGLPTDAFDAIIHTRSGFKHQNCQ